MNSPDRSSEARGCGGDVAAYALGALEPAEAEAFEAHLETCGVCRDELAAFRTVVDVLPMSAPQHPAPRRLRRRVISTVRREARTRGEQQDRPISERLSLRQPAFALAAVLVVVALTVAALTLSGGKPHTRVYAAQVVGSRGSAEVTVTGNQAQLVVRHFPRPPAGKIYEVWLARRGQAPTPTGALFSVPSSGDSNVALPSDLRGVHLVLVTPEPAGGTRVPTHAPIITAALS
jgi:anti-sigma factor RsiW